MDIFALMRRGSHTDLVSDTPQVGFTGEVELPEEPDIVGSASDIGPPRTIDTALGPMTFQRYSTVANREEVDRGGSFNSDLEEVSRRSNGCSCVKRSWLRSQIAGNS